MGEKIDRVDRLLDKAVCSLNDGYVPAREALADGEVMAVLEAIASAAGVELIRSLGFVGNAHYCPDCMNHFHADHGQHQPDCSVFAEWPAEDEEDDRDW